MRIRIVALILTFGVHVTTAHAQYVVNLAQPSGTSNTRPVAAGSTPTIVLQNRLPHVKYNINLGLAYRQLPPITLPAGGIPGLRVGLAGPGGGPPTACQIAEEAAKKSLAPWDKEFSSASDESTVPSLLARGRALVDEMLTACGGIDNTTDDGKRIVARVDAITQSASMIILNVPMIGEGQQLTVRVGRDTPAREWVLILDTPSTGSWLTSYGLNFAANFGRDYFSKANTGTGQDGTFTITQKHYRSVDALQYVPSVHFTHVPADAPVRNFWTWTLGFGATQQAPAAIFGASYVVRQNAQFVFGAMVTGMRGLKGDFEVGQVVKENLSSDALTKTGPMVTPFFGITVNFSANPFAGDAPKKEAGATEKPATGTEKPAPGTEKPAPGTEKPGAATEKPAPGTEKPGGAK